MIDDVRKVQSGWERKGKMSKKKRIIKNWCNDKGVDEVPDI